MEYEDLFEIANPEPRNDGLISGSLPGSKGKMEQMLFMMNRADYITRRVKKYGPFFRTRLFGKHVVVICEDQEALKMFETDLLVATPGVEPPVVRFYKGAKANVLGCDDRNGTAVGGHHMTQRDHFTRALNELFKKSGPFWDRTEKCVRAYFESVVGSETTKVALDVVAMGVTHEILKHAVYHPRYLEQKFLDEFVAKLGSHTDLGDALCAEVDRRLMKKVTGFDERERTDVIGCYIKTSLKLDEFTIDSLKTHIGGPAFNFMTQVRPVLKGGLRDCGKLTADQLFQKWGAQNGIPLAVREATRDFVYKGVTIKKGTPVGLGYSEMPQPVVFGVDHHICPFADFSQEFIPWLLNLITDVYELGHEIVDGDAGKKIDMLIITPRVVVPPQEELLTPEVYFCGGGLSAAADDDDSDRQQQQQQVATLAVGDKKNVVEKKKTVVERVKTVVVSPPPQQKKKLHDLVWLDQQGRQEQRLSIKELWSRAGEVAVKIVGEFGARPGDRVVLCYPPGVEFYVAFWASLRAGTVAVPVYPPSPGKLEQGVAKLALVSTSAGARLCLTEDTVNFLRRTRGLAYSWPSQLVWHSTTQSWTYFSSSSSSSSSSLDAASADDVAFLQYTSGSTGEPKGVIVGHDNLDHNVVTVIHSLNSRAFESSSRLGRRGKGETTQTTTPQNKTLVSWLPAYHDLGLVYAHVAPCVHGETMVYMSPLTFLATPERWFEAASKYKATYLAAPDFGYRLATKRHRELAAKTNIRGGVQSPTKLDLSGLKWCASAAERVRASTYVELVETLGPHGLQAALTPAYGLAESVVGVSGTFQADMATVRVSKYRPDLVCCGDDFVPDVIIKIVDKDTRRELKGRDNQIGEIWISSPSVARGYWGKTALSDETFRAHLNPHDGRSYLRTGDEGFVENGGVYVCGRIKDLIILDGVNIYAEDVETAVVANIPNDVIRHGAVAAFSVDDGAAEKLVVVYEHRSLDADVARETSKLLARTVVRELGSRPSRVVAVAAKTIPRTTSGKIRRRATRDALLKDDLAHVVDDLSFDGGVGGPTTTPHGSKTQRGHGSKHSSAQAEASAQASAEAPSSSEATAVTFDAKQTPPQPLPVAAAAAAAQRQLSSASLTSETAKVTFDVKAPTQARSVDSQSTPSADSRGQPKTAAPAATTPDKERGSNTSFFFWNFWQPSQPSRRRGLVSSPSRRQSFMRRKSARGSARGLGQRKKSLSRLLSRTFSTASPTPRSMCRVLNQVTKVVEERGDEPFMIWLDEKGREWGEPYSFRRLWDRAGAVGLKIRTDCGVEKQDRVMLCYAPGPEFYVAFWGCLRAAVVAVPVYPPNPSRMDVGIEKLGLVRNACQAKLCLTDDQVSFLKRTKGFFHTWPTELEWRNTQSGFDTGPSASSSSPFSNFFGGLTRANSAASASGSDDGLVLDDATDDDLAFLQFTSGSTGDPKGVMIGFDTLWYHLRDVSVPYFEKSKRVRSVPGYDPDVDRYVSISWLPQYHDLGLVFQHVHRLFDGALTVNMSPLAFLGNPLLWLRAASEYRANFLVSPDFGYRLLVRRLAMRKSLPDTAYDLTCVVACLNAAERVRESTCTDLEAALARFGFNAVMCPGYGLAESVASVCADFRVDLADLPVERFGSSPERENTENDEASRGNDICCGGGTPPDGGFLGVTLKIVDPDTRQELLQTGAVGEIWVSSRSVARGYWGRPELTDATFKARLTPDDGLEYLRTGDLAYLDLKKRLCICARLKDLIIVNGANYYPEDLEHAAQSAYDDAIRPGCLAAFAVEDADGNERAVLVFELRYQYKDKAGEVIEAVHQAISKNVGIQPRVVAISERSIPKTTSGKIRRRATRDALRDGTLPVIRDFQSPVMQGVRRGRAAERAPPSVGQKKNTHPDAFEEEKEAVVMPTSSHKLPPVPPLESSIAVVGAGLGGLSLVFELHRQGYRNITVFEKESAPGGKARGVWCQDLGRYVGGGQYTVNQGYTAVTGLAAELNVPLRGEESGGVGSTNNPDQEDRKLIFDVQARTYVPFGPTIAASRKSIAPTLRAISKALEQTPAIGFSSQSNSSRGVHKSDVIQGASLQSYFESQGLQTDKAVRASEAIDLVYAPAGYLSARDPVPAVYRTKPLRFPFTGWSFVRPDAFRLLCEALKERVERVEETVVKTACPVHTIQRSETSGVVINGTLRFDYMVSTASPSDLVPLLADAGPVERQVAASIVTADYVCTVATIRGIPEIFFVPEHWRPGLVGRVYLVSKVDTMATEKHDPSKSTLYSCFQYGTLYDGTKAGTRLSDDQLSQLLEADIRLFGGTLEAIHGRTRWPFFPHVGDGEAVETGIMDRFEALQGLNRTYWAGAFAAFELTETTTAYSKELVRRFFSVQRKGPTAQIIETNKQKNLPPSAGTIPAKSSKVVPSAASRRERRTLETVIEVVSSHIGWHVSPENTLQSLAIESTRVVTIIEDIATALAIDPDEISIEEVLTGEITIAEFARLLPSAEIDDAPSAASRREPRTQHGVDDARSAASRRERRTLETVIEVVSSHIGWHVSPENTLQSLAIESTRVVTIIEDIATALDIDPDEISIEEVLTGEITIAEFARLLPSPGVEDAPTAASHHERRTLETVIEVVSSHIGWHVSPENTLQSLAIESTRVVTIIEDIATALDIDPDEISIEDVLTGEITIAEFARLLPSPEGDGMAQTASTRPLIGARARKAVASVPAIDVVQSVLSEHLERTVEPEEVLQELGIDSRLVLGMVQDLSDKLDIDRSDISVIDLMSGDFTVGDWAESLEGLRLNHGALASAKAEGGHLATDHRIGVVADVPKSRGASAEERLLEMQGHIQILEARLDRRSWLQVCVLQLFTLLVPTIYYGLTFWLPLFVVFVTAKRTRSIGLSVAMVPVITLSHAFASAFLLVVLKWTVVGRQKERRIPIWNESFACRLIVRKCYQYCTTFSWWRFQSYSPWLNFLLRELGADIGTGARLATTAITEDHDLVSVGDGSVVHGTVCCAYTDRARRQQLLRTKIEDDCSVGELSLVPPGTHVKDDATIGDSSQIPPDVRVVVGTWYGNPAKKHPDETVVVPEEALAHRDKSDVLDYARFVFWFILAPFVWALSFGPAAVVFFVIRDVAGLLVALLLMWVYMSIAAIVATVFAVAAKWMLLGTVREGYHAPKGWYAARKLVVDGFVTLSVAGMKYAEQTGSLLLISNAVKVFVLRSLGAKVAYRTFVVGTLRDSMWTQYDLLEIPEGCFCGAASGISCYDYSKQYGLVRRVKTSLGNKCYLGATAFVAPGSVLEDGSTVAACSRTAANQRVASNTLVIGYARTIKNSLDAAAAGDIGELSQEKVEYENNVVTAISLVLGFIFTGSYILVVYVFATIVVRGQFLPNGNDALFCLSLSVMLVLVILGAVPFFFLLRGFMKKYVFVGTHRAGYYEVGTSTWRNHLIDLNFGIGIRQIMLMIIGGTELEVLYQRMLGATIEGDVHLDGAFIHEPDLVNIKEGTVLEQYATLSPHDLRRGGLKLAPVQVGRNCRLRSEAIVHGSSSLNSDVDVFYRGKPINNSTLIPKHKDLDHVTLYAGFPSKPYVLDEELLNTNNIVDPPAGDKGTQFASTNGSLLERIQHRVEATLSFLCSRLSGPAIRAPYRTLLASLLLIMCMSIGWVAYDPVTDVERLWAVPNTRAMRDRDWVEDRFGDEPAPSEVYLNRGSADTNVLTKGALLEAFDVHDFVESIESHQGKYGYDERTCASTYWLSSEEAEIHRCQKESVLALWEYNRTALELDPDVLETVRVGLERDETGGTPDCCSPVSRIVDVPAVVGKMEFDSETGALVGAGALRMLFMLDQDLHRKVRIDPAVQRLESKFDRRLRDENWASFERALPLTRTGYLENVIDAYDEDSVFILISFAVIVAYACFALHNWRRPLYSRSLLALGSVLTGILSTSGAFGMAIACGVDFSWTTNIAIFIAIVIALDDSFVLMGEVDMTTPSNGVGFGMHALEIDGRAVVESGASVEQVTAKRIQATILRYTNLAVVFSSLSGRVLLSLLLFKNNPDLTAVSYHSPPTHRAAPSIMVTSITDACSFAAASITPVPDISAFCRFSAAAVIVDFFMQLTFFVALFTLDQRRKVRRAAAKYRETLEDLESDARPSLQRRMTLARLRSQSRKTLDEMKSPARLGRAVSTKSTLNYPGGKQAPLLGTSTTGSSLSSTATRSLLSLSSAAETYVRTLLSPVGKFTVLAVSAGVLVMAVIGTTRVEVDAQQFENAHGGYFVRAEKFRRKYFGAGAELLPVGLYTKKADYFESRRALRTLIEEYSDRHYVIDASLQSNWFYAYEEWLNGTESANFTGTTSANQESAEWLDGLRTFLDTDGSAYSEKVLFDPNDGSISATEIDSFWSTDGATRGDVARRMRKSRDDVRGTELGTVLLVSPEFIWSETLLAIQQSMRVAMAITVSVVTVILLVTLGNVFAATLVASLVAFVAVATLGAMYWFNDDLNFITNFFIVIAIGLSTDAPAHICRAFIDSQAPTRERRVAEALARVGAPVFRGGVSTILGVFVTAFSKTYTFQVFFR